jgi:hypothetical protein
MIPINIPWHELERMRSRKEREEEEEKEAERVLYILL